MINSDPPRNQTPAAIDREVEAIVTAGPHGALTVAGIATAVVVLTWLLFYLLVFLPRTGVP